MDLDGANALVTGGAAGIGAGIARGLAADLDEHAGRETAARIGGSFVRADISTDDGVRTAVDTAGRLPGRVSGQPSRLLPLIDWQTALPSSGTGARRSGHR
jgi:NAD(P)-dependent dehydrogenase (short-subunit alcohol dehydrogenase family)